MTPFYSRHTSTRAVKEAVSLLHRPKTREKQRLLGVHIALLRHPRGAIQGDTLPCWRSSLQNDTQGTHSAFGRGGGGVILSPAAFLEQKGKGFSRLRRAGDAHCQARRPAAGVDTQYRGLTAMCGCHYGSISLEAHLGDALLGRGMAGGRQGRAFPP